MRTVALSSSLAHLKDELKNLGYKVYLEDEIDFPVDVFIYTQDNEQSSLYSTAQKLDNLACRIPKQIKIFMEPAYRR